MFSKLTRLVSTTSATNSDQADFYRAMMRKEAELGGRLFGPIPKDHRREFFCLDRHTWVWHEEWKDASGKWQHRTTRYDVRTNDILKAQDGLGYQQVSPEEAHNLSQAVGMYGEYVLQPLYGSTVH